MLQYGYALLKLKHSRLWWVCIVMAARIKPSLLKKLTTCLIFVWMYIDVYVYWFCVSVCCVNVLLCECYCICWLLFDCCWVILTHCHHHCRRRRCYLFLFVCGSRRKRVACARIFCVARRLFVLCCSRTTPYSQYLYQVLYLVRVQYLVCMYQVLGASGTVR